jgi:hypothetical protein
MVRQVNDHSSLVFTTEMSFKYIAESFRVLLLVIDYAAQGPSD